MDRPMLMAIVIAFLLLLLAMMVVGWRRRQQRQSGLPRPQAVPADAGVELMSVDAFYVATTVAGEPLNRISVAGLGYRARARVSVTEGGLALAIPGQEAIFIPADDIRTIERATWTIDRVVERDGLVLVSWSLGDADAPQTMLDSYLRITDPDAAELFFTTMQRFHAADNQTDSPQTGGPAR